MKPLFSKKEIRTILERGLLTGKWSINQFNKKSKNPTIPRKEFLEENPQFMDANFRDLEAYRNTHGKL